MAKQRGKSGRKARGKKSKNLFQRIDWASVKRVLTLVAWLALIVLVLALVARYLLHNTKQEHAQSIAAAYRDSLEVVRIPPTVPSERVAYQGFASYFNAKWHVPNCVVYELTAEELNGDVQRYGNFERDMNVQGCPEAWAYSGSGYDRGHMAPAADFKWTERGMRQSFLMTNVCPQVKALNEGTWNKLEEKVRQWVMRDSALIVVAGPVPDTNLTTMPQSGVVIPKRFFKIVFAPYAQPMRAIAFILPNKACNGKLKSYVTSVDEVERITHMDFFSILPDDYEDELEKRAHWELWAQ